MGDAALVLTVEWQPLLCLIVDIQTDYETF